MERSALQTNQHYICSTYPLGDVVVRNQVDRIQVVRIQNDPGPVEDIHILVEEVDQIQDDLVQVEQLQTNVLEEEEVDRKLYLEEDTVVVVPGRMAA